jgi:MFS transporter, DHA1 family, solute carrier family 18 (vesicular amine transporter), member 1/2
MKNSAESLEMDKNAKIALLVVTMAIFTDMLVYTTIVPVLPKYATGLGVSQQLIGVVFASYAVVFLAATPLVGVFSDKYGPRKPMILGLAGLFLSTLLFACAGNIEPLIIVRALQGLSAAATWTAGLALIADVFPSSQRQQAAGMALVGSFAGTLIAPSFGGLLYDAGGYLLPFLVAAGLVLVDGLARVFLLRDPPVRGTEKKPALSSLVKDWAIILFAGVITLTAGISGMLGPTIPLFLQSHLQSSPGAIGLLFGVVSVAGLIFSPLSYLITGRFGRRRVVVIGLIIAAVLLPAPTLSNSYVAGAAIMFVIGAVIAVVLSSVPQEMNDIVERKGTSGFGAVSAIYSLALSFGMMARPVAGSFGLMTAMLIGGCAMVVYALAPAAGSHTMDHDQEVINVVSA